MVSAMTVSPLTPSSSRPYDPIDLSSKAFWSGTAADRETSFAELRAARPVSWHPPVEDSLMHDPEDHGYWAVTRHADVVTVSRDSETYLSGKGVLFENIPEELLEASQSFLAMDPPRHTLIRKVVHSAFTPRQVRRIEDSIKENARIIVGELREAGSGADFVDHCAKELPIRTLSDMVGIPESERAQVASAADALVSWGDEVYLDGRNPLEVLVGNQMYLHQVAGALAGIGGPIPVTTSSARWCTPRWTATGSPMPRSRRSSCCWRSRVTTPPARPPATPCGR